MASIFCRKRKNGATWYVQYYVDGRVIQKRVGKSKTMAKKVAGEIEAKQERKDANLEPRDHDLREFFQEYLDCTRNNVSANYHRRNVITIKNFLKFLDKKHLRTKQLSQLNLKLFEEYMAWRLRQKNQQNGRPIKKRTVNLEVSALKTFLNKAVKWQYLHNNPLIHVEYLKQDDSKKIRSLTAVEVQQVLDNSPEWFYPILFTMLYTGMREGEIIHLEWDDVNFDKRMIHIRKKDFWMPKSSGRGIRERDIALTDGLVTFLKMHKLKDGGKDNWVFHNRDGKQLKPGLRKVLGRITKKLGFPEVTQVHALRHTYATHLIKCCKDIAVAQAQLGHTDIRTTMKYADMLSEHQAKAANMLDYGIQEKKKPRNVVRVGL
jgi:integrase